MRLPLLMLPAPLHPLEPQLRLLPRLPAPPLLRRLLLQRLSSNSAPLLLAASASVCRLAQALPALLALLALRIRRCLLRKAGAVVEEAVDAVGGDELAEQSNAHSRYVVRPCGVGTSWFVVGGCMLHTTTRDWVNRDVAGERASKHAHWPSRKPKRASERAQRAHAPQFLCGCPLVLRTEKRRNSLTSPAPVGAQVNTPTPQAPPPPARCAIRTNSASPLPLPSTFCESGDRTQQNDGAHSAVDAGRRGTTGHRQQSQRNKHRQTQIDGRAKVSRERGRNEQTNLDDQVVLEFVHAHSGRVRVPVAQGADISQQRSKQASRGKCVAQGVSNASATKPAENAEGRHDGSIATQQPAKPPRGTSKHAHHA